MGTAQVRRNQKHSHAKITWLHASTNAKFVKINPRIALWELITEHAQIDSEIFIIHDSSQLGLLRQVMLDLFTIFSKGGIVLWCFQGTCQSFTLPVNELIRSVILQVGFQGYDMIWWVYLRVSFLNHLKAFKSLLIPPLFVITGTRRK